MKYCFSFLLGALLLADPSWSQTISSLSPTRNARAVSRSATIMATFSGPAPTAALRVFSARTGGRKAGTTIINGNSIVLAPARNFRAGETVAATVVPAAAGAGQVWQFVTAATGGTGQFTLVSAVNTATGIMGNSSSPVALADLDGDGDLDALVPPGNTGQVLAWFPNDGSGHLANANRSIATANPVSTVAVGDIDADGDLDVVAAASRPSQFDVARNDGTGNFTTTALPTNPLTTAVSTPLLADIDGDTDLDLVYYNWGSQAPRQVEVRRNDGSGSFGPAQASLVAQQYGYATIQAADLDLDGDLDLVLCGTATVNGINGFVQPLLNNGQGSFIPGTVYPSSNYSGGAALGDIDGDGDLDLAVADFDSSSPVKLLLNNGNATFTAGATLVSGAVAQLATFADVDGDGDPDLVVHGSGDFLHLNDGRGNFGPVIIISSRGAPYALAVADMDNDGDLDLVTIDNDANAPLQVRLNGTVSAIRPVQMTAFKYWPNPVPSATSVHIELAGFGPATATLRDVLGRVVRQQRWSGPAIAMPTAGLRTGVYLLTVEGIGQAPTTGRVAVE